MAALAALPLLWGAARGEGEAPRASAGSLPVQERAVESPSALDATLSRLHAMDAVLRKDSCRRANGLERACEDTWGKEDWRRPKGWGATKAKWRSKVDWDLCEQYDMRVLATRATRIALMGAEAQERAQRETASHKYYSKMSGVRVLGDGAAPEGASPLSSGRRPGPSSDGAGARPAAPFPSAQLPAKFLGLCICRLASMIKSWTRPSRRGVRAGPARRARLSEALCEVFLWFRRRWSASALALRCVELRATTSSTSCPSSGPTSRSA